MCKHRSLGDSYFYRQVSVTWRSIYAVFVWWIFSILSVNAQNDWDWEWGNPTLPGYSYNGIAVGDSRTVIVGDDGMGAVRDGDGDWRIFDTGVRHALHDVVWTGEEFVAVGERGVVITSSDGELWTSYASGTDAWLSSVAWTGDVLVMVGANEILMSSDRGRTWTIQQTELVPYGFINEVVWADEKFIAVGSHGFIITSEDGMTWVQRETDTSRTFTSVVWTDSQFVAFGGDHAQYVVATSFDGTDWSVSEIAGTYLYSRSMAWTGERFVVAGEGRFITSTNLKDWDVHFLDSPMTFNDLLWTGSILVATTGGGVFTSPDGIEWTDQRKGLLWDGIWESVVWAGNQWVVAGSGGTIATSPDGIEWTKRDSGVDVTISSIIWTGSRLVAVCLDGTVLMSDGGENWQAHDPGFYQWSLNAIAWNGASFVAVGPKGVIGSEDGVHWELRLEANFLMDVIWTGTEFAIQSYFGSVLSSPDGMNWTSGSGARGGNALTYTGSHLVMVGDEIAVRGDDGTVWRIANPSGNFFYGVVVAGNEVLALGSRKIWSSSDLQNWRPDPIFSQWASFWFKAGAWNGEKLVVVGDRGTILTGVPRPLDGPNIFSDWLEENEDGKDLKEALVDYAMGAKSPLADNRSYRPGMSISDSGFPEFLFSRNIDRKDVAFELQVTSDLIHWENIAELQNGGWRNISPGITIREFGTGSSGLRNVAVGELFEVGLDKERTASFYRVKIQLLE